MTELETTLRTIYNEKETKLLPTNIRNGVSIMGVTGEYSGVTVNVSNMDVSVEGTELIFSEGGNE